MRPREAAHLLGFGRAWFLHRWARDRSPVSAFRPCHDATESLFVHIPKAAGLSVQKALYGETALNGHAPAIAFQSRDPDRFARYFTFTLLRDPAERFASAFRFLKSGGLTGADRNWSARHLAAHDSPEALLAAMRAPLTRARVMSWKHFAPQSWFVAGHNGSVALDFLGRVEEIDAALAHVGDRLGLALRPERLNRSRSGGDRPGPEMRRLVERFYAADVALYEALPALSSTVTR